MSKFGWSYPPGCNGPPDDEEEDPENEKGEAMSEQMPAVIRCERCPRPIQRRLDSPLGPWMQDTHERSELFTDVCVVCEDDIQNEILRTKGVE